MKRFFHLFTVLSTLGVMSTRPLCAAQERHHYTLSEDSLALYRLQTIEVTATRATKSTPVAFTNLSSDQIREQNYGLDIPSLLCHTPSLLATNQTGIGIGGTSMRLRGTDATRINVTVNGVAMNNPDSHEMYWYDTPDLASAVGDIQIQRGAGTSTHGCGAFGGAISMTTTTLPTDFGGDISLTYGSYNTAKQALHLSSGVIDDHWIVDARVTNIRSDGYIDRGATNLSSYFLQGGYYNRGTMVKLISFGGKSKTYLTYNGVTKEEISLYGRRYHTSGQYTTDCGLYTLSDGTRVDYFDDESDNYRQLNNQLIVDHNLSKRWKMNIVGFYTYGYGFYRQYKDDAWLAGYNNLPTAIAQADLVRQKQMETHFGGLNTTFRYRDKSRELILGSSYSLYNSPHWGTIDWIDGVERALYSGHWYDNNVYKHDANIFAKLRQCIGSKLYLFADLQYRIVDYRAWGTNDNYNWDSGTMQPIAIDKQYHFINPHFGLSYRPTEHHNLYVSFAIANNEPTRADFTDRYLFSDDYDTLPSPEQLYDYELGYSYSNSSIELSANLYYMFYRNQLIHTGMVNDSSDALNVNVPRSYRAGIELQAVWRVTSWLNIGANTTLSRNKILNYVDLLADSPTYGKNLGTNSISYSPEVLASDYINIHYKGFEAILRTTYVGEQYFTNTENRNLMLDAYNFTNLNLSYTLPSKSIKRLRIGITIYNLFNQLYESNGYGYSYIYKGVQYDEAFYFPQAPIHLLANVSLNF